MSRCFPFPPPGYDKKGRAEEPDLIKKEKLKEEKRKEKKHKKEKKDKEKKDDKEKRDKERSDEKRREKKDKKEKHRDKKKDKDKGRDKHNNIKILSDDKRFAGQPEGYSGEKKEKNKDKAKENGFVALDEKRTGGYSSGCNGVGLNRDSPLAPENKALASRTTNERGRTSNQLHEKYLGTEERKDQGMVISPGVIAAPLVDGKERSREKINDGKIGIRVDARPSGNVLHHNQVEARLGGNALVPNKVEPRVDGIALVQTRFEAVPGGNTLVEDRAESISGGNALVHDRVVGRASEGNALVQKSNEMLQNRVEAIARPVERSIDCRADWREKIGEKEVDDKKQEKRKHKDRHRSSKKDKEREKEKKKEGKVRKQESIHVEERHRKDSSKSQLEHSTLGDTHMSDCLDTQDIKLQSPPNDGHTIATAHENVKKRKQFEPNGVVHEDNPGPKKIARTLHSLHPLTQNGRPLGPCQGSSIFAPGLEQAPDNVKPESKECGLNGMIDVQPVKKPPQAVHADKKKETSRKPPHPDAKYLSEVLSVPKVDGWPDFDAQDWLFSSSRPPQSRDTKVEASGVDEAPQVWAEAQRIESADVIALPYVIPL